MNPMTQKLLYALPKSLQRSMLMKNITINYDLDSKIVFKIAETQSELEGAFRLLYDAYVRVNLQKPNDSKLRVTPYHALDSTTTIVAKIDDKVIGTLSLIRWGALGIPSESLSDFLYHRQSGIQFAEVSALAIDREYKGQIFLHLLKYMYNYCTDYFGVDELIAVIVTHKLAPIFYESILQFQPLSQKVHGDYAFANYQKVIVEDLNLHMARKAYSEIYNHLPRDKNLFHFFTEYQCPNFKFPKRTSFLISDPVMNRDLFKYFFMERTQAINDIPENIKPYILQKYGLQRRVSKVVSDRIEVKARGFCVKGGVQIPIKIKNISKYGFCIHAQLPFVTKGEIGQFYFYLGPDVKINVSAVSVWTGNENSY
ncbi:MAG TPA: hypothetical protein PLJ21_13590, partial [Pseudobdellovibrionaceae bacterium]|nr:hypothetical protein [Pseudobdellovibrionaceae bacterium]